MAVMAMCKYFWLWCEVFFSNSVALPRRNLLEYLFRNCVAQAGAGQLRRALACLTAMSAGATERSQLSALPCWRRAAAEPVPLATSPRKAHSVQCLCIGTLVKVLGTLSALFSPSQLR